MREENAIIKDVTISMEDHGFLTFDLFLEGNGWRCAFGGYTIGRGYLGADTFEAKRGEGLEAMMRIMDTVGVSKWEDLVGKYCRVRTESWGSTIDIIGNIIKDKWFNIREFFKEKQNEAKK